MKYINKKGNYDIKFYKSLRQINLRHHLETQELLKNHSGFT